MQKLKLTQTLTQKLSPQQIQFIKLLQVPTIELDARIQEEIEINPALEESRDEEVFKNEENEVDDQFEQYENDSLEEINIEEYIHQDDISGYKMQGDGPGSDNEDKEFPIATTQSLTDSLINQLGYLALSEKEYLIGMQLIGSIDSDGYIRREIESIVNDLAFLQNISTNYREVKEVLKKVQNFEPPGIAAQNLQECLHIQLLKKQETGVKIAQIAVKIIMLCFEAFKKKHYDKIQKKLDISEEDLRAAISLITKLNPKPGNSGQPSLKAHYIIPDFVVKEINGRLEVSLNAKNAPDLKVSRSYNEMLETYDKSKKKDKKMRQTVSFVKQKLDAARWFIDAIKQRQETLLKTMNAIVTYQHSFFLSGDESKLRPMILKDIALEIDMDISTVSRVANSKSVHTDFGLFPLKFFFSESITTESGEDVSSKEVKYTLKHFIEREDKKKPLSDDKLEKLLKDKGYNIARRTVAKYREQMGIPVARLRKEI